MEVDDGADGFTSLIKFCGRVCHFSRHRRLVGHASNFAFLREVRIAKKKSLRRRFSSCAGSDDPLFLHASRLLHANVRWLVAFNVT